MDKIRPFALAFALLLIPFAMWQAWSRNATAAWSLMAVTAVVVGFFFIRDWRNRL